MCAGVRVGASGASVVWCGGGIFTKHTKKPTPAAILAPALGRNRLYLRLRVAFYAFEITGGYLMGPVIAVQLVFSVAACVQGRLLDSPCRSMCTDRWL